MEREYNVAEYNKKAFQLMKLILRNILREKNKTNKRNLTNHTFLLIDNLKKKKKSLTKYNYYITACISRFIAKLWKRNQPSTVL